MTEISVFEMLDEMISDFNRACENEGRFKKYRRSLLVSGGVVAHLGITYAVYNYLFPDVHTARAMALRCVSYLNPISMFFGVVGVAEIYLGISGLASRRKISTSDVFQNVNVNINSIVDPNSIEVDSFVNITRGTVFNSLDEMVEKLKVHPFCENIQKYASYYLDDVSFEEMACRVEYLMCYSDVKYKALFDEIGSNSYKYKEIKDIRRLFGER